MLVALLELIHSLLAFSWCVRTGMPFVSHGVRPTQALALRSRRREGPAGRLVALAGRRPRLAALPVLAQRRVLRELRKALGILLGVAVLRV